MVEVSQIQLYFKLWSRILFISHQENLYRREIHLCMSLLANVGDEAFPLKSFLMKPYPSRKLDQNKRIFNCQISRARRFVENVFGILTCRSRVFKQAIPLEPEKVERIVLACCALDNFLRTKKSSTEYLAPGMLDEDIENGSVNFGSWRQEIGNDLPGLTQQSGNRSSNNVREIRVLRLFLYFNTNGQVSWQWDFFNNLPD